MQFPLQPYSTLEVYPIRHPQQCNAHSSAFQSSKQASCFCNCSEVRVKWLVKLRMSEICNENRGVRLKGEVFCRFLIIFFKKTMTRGNQREIDRERARKRNADKEAQGQKSEFFKTKETHAEIMRNKQKKFEGEPQEKPEQGKGGKKEKNYKVQE